MPELNRQQLASDGPLWAFHEQFISYSISKTGETFIPFRIKQTIFLREDYKLHLWIWRVVVLMLLKIAAHINGIRMTENKVNAKHSIKKRFSYGRESFLTSWSFCLQKSLQEKMQLLPVPPKTLKRRFKLQKNVLLGRWAKLKMILSWKNRLVPEEWLKEVWNRLVSNINRAHQWIHGVIKRRQLQLVYYKLFICDL